MSSILGALLFGGAGATYLVLMRRLSRYRTPQSKPSWRESWTKGLDRANYSPEGQDPLHALLPWIFVVFALALTGFVVMFAYSGLPPEEWFKGW